MIPNLALALLLQAAPVDVEIDFSQVPELRPWAEKAKALCQEWYPAFVDYLASKDYTPPAAFRIVFEKDKEGIASASGTTIRVAADWVKRNPEDWGMILHEMVHVIQSYPRGCPRWVTEGVADYLRYFIFEKKAVTAKGRRKGGYRDAYRTTASFFAWIAERHDPEIVKKLNAAARARSYRDEIFKEATGRDLETLWQDYVSEH
jgi:hypothetical protein